MTALSPAIRGAVLFAFAASLCGQASVAQADALFDTSFVVTDPFSNDTDPNSDASFVKWSFADRGIDPGRGNPTWGMFGRTSYSSIGDARTNDQVFRFTLSPHSGYALNLTSFSFDLAASRSSLATTDYAAQAFVFSSRDSQATPIAAGFAIDTTGDGAPSAFTTWAGNLSTNPLFQNVTEPITFSVYITGNDAHSYAFLDNMRVEGTTVPAIPEPSTVLCAAFGAAACAVSFVRRRKRTAVKIAQTPE